MIVLSMPRLNSRSANRTNNANDLHSTANAEAACRLIEAMLAAYSSAFLT
jgi:hypothetical protein